MGKASNCTETERRVIESLRNEGKSLADIARLVKRSKTLVFRALKPVTVALRRGRRRKTTVAFDRLLVRKIKANPFERRTTFLFSLCIGYGSVGWGVTLMKICKQCVVSELLSSGDFDG